MAARDEFPAERVPVIAGVGEVMERSVDGPGREPARLMADAVLAAQADAGADLVASTDSFDIIQEISWPYRDPVATICGLLGIQPSRAVHGPIGGETPVRAIHDAALRIAARATKTAIVCGAEAQYSVRRAAQLGVDPPWTSRWEDFKPVRAGEAQGDLARRLDVAIPAHVYPFYENAIRAAWSLSFEAAQQESAELWAGLSTVASGRSCSWQKRPLGAQEILTVSADNRLIAWPYPKLMIANPLVNQGAAVILTSLATARTLGIPETKLVYVWGGAAANSPADYLTRASYAASEAMTASLSGATDVLREAGRSSFDAIELYSCFPCVPKMARRVLGLSATASISVTGGLTFFGAPLNNYMGHAAVAMTQRIRARGDQIGLLYGQGGYLTKHHALVLAGVPPRAGLREDYRVEWTERPCDIRVLSDYAGPASIETFTVLFDRAGKPRHGVVIARTPGKARLIARTPVDDAQSMACLLSAESEPIGMVGRAHMAGDGVPEWALG